MTYRLLYDNACCYECPGAPTVLAEGKTLEELVDNLTAPRHKYWDYHYPECSNMIEDSAVTLIQVLDKSILKDWIS